MIEYKFMPMYIKELKIAIRYCEDLSTGKIKPVRPYEGLCGNMASAIKYNLFGEMLCSIHIDIDLTKYPNYSGSFAYPIESCCKGIDSQVYYQGIEHCSPDNMWNPEHPYGKRRLEFTAWMAIELKRNLDILLIEQEQNS